MDASGDGCWNARSLTGTSRCSRSPGASRLAEDQVVLVDVARDGQRDVVAGPRMIHLPVLDLHRTDRLDKIGRMAPDVDAIAHSEGAVRRTPATERWPNQWVTVPIASAGWCCSDMLGLLPAPHCLGATLHPSTTIVAPSASCPSCCTARRPEQLPREGGRATPLEQGELQARSWPARCHQEVRRRIRFVDAFTVPTTYWHRLDDGRVQCDLCPP